MDSDRTRSIDDQQEDLYTKNMQRVATFLLSSKLDKGKTFERLKDILNGVTIDGEKEEELLQVFHSSAEKYIENIVRESLEREGSDADKRYLNFPSNIKDIGDAALRMIAHVERQELEWKSVSKELLVEISNIVNPLTEEGIREKYKEEISLFMTSYNATVEDLGEAHGGTINDDEKSLAFDIAWKNIFSGKEIFPEAKDILFDILKDI